MHIWFFFLKTKYDIKTKYLIINIIAGLLLYLSQLSSSIQSHSWLLVSSTLIIALNDFHFLSQCAEKLKLAPVFCPFEVKSLQPKLHCQKKKTKKRAAMTKHL